MSKRFSFIIPLLLFIAAMAQAQGIAFEQSLTYSQAVALAKKEGKMLFMDCYTSWCIPCAKMSKEIFPQAICGEYFNPRFVSIKMDMEKGEGKELAKKFQIMSYPTFLFIDANGKEINRMVGGSPDAKTFINKVKEVTNPENSLAKMKEVFDKNPYDYKQGMKYVKALLDHNMDATEVMDKIYSNPYESQRYDKEFMSYYLSSCDIRSPRFDRLMFDRNKMNEHMGKENINKMIFDTYRKDMYLVADERPHNYTVDDVRKCAMITAMLELPADKAETHLPRIAYYIIAKEYEALIRYYKQIVAYLPSNDSYKGIINGFLAKQYHHMNEKQKMEVKEYFDNCARNASREGNYYTEIKNYLDN